jgi:hypothetical protein
MKKNYVLVVFGKELPRKWQKFETIIAPALLERKIIDNGAVFVDIDKLIGPGSIQEAYNLADNISKLTAPDGKSIPEIFKYHGYEIWWMNYENIHRNFCLPYTQYKNLLSRLKDFDNAYLFRPLNPHFFRYFLKAYGRKCFILRDFRPSLPIPIGVIIEVAISLLSLPWLLISRPKIMLWTSDIFSPPRRYDFRMGFIYEELLRKKLPFVELIRSVERWPLVLKHAWERKRPVFYSSAVIFFIYFIGKFFKNKETKEPARLALPSEPDDRFWLAASTHYVHNFYGTIWSISIIKFVLRLIGIRVAIISTGSYRTFHEIIACKLAGIKTIGIQHSAATKYFLASEFMPGFNGRKSLSVDIYGLWSSWWREYYLANSKAYSPEQLFVSGPMRPLVKNVVAAGGTSQGKLRVLFISEQLADPSEVLPYLQTLLENKELDLGIKFRPYRDGFELWLKKDSPEIYKEIVERAKIFRGTTEEAIDYCDVVVGSHSTAVLEALLQLKPFVFFQTGKWGDYFELGLFSDGKFFAENPNELMKRIRVSREIVVSDLREAQERFFGDPYQNGSKWVVEQAQKSL